MFSHGATRSVRTQTVCRLAFTANGALRSSLYSTSVGLKVASAQSRLVCKSPARSFTTSVPSSLAADSTRNHSLFTNTINNVKPELLSSLDFINLSDRQSFSGHYFRSDGEPSMFKIRFYRKGTTQIRFPPNTAGFLYYVAPPSSQPLGGQLRFRVTNDPKPESFYNGHDLLHPTYRLPWKIPVIAALRATSVTGGYAGLADLLQATGYVNQAMIEACLQPRYNIQQNADVLLKLGDPFYMDFQKERYVWFTLREKAEKHSIGFFKQLVPGNKTFPYKGSAHVCFEAATTEDGKPAAAVRVLKILDPIEHDDSQPATNFAEPREGRLLAKTTGQILLRLVNPDPESPVGAFVNGGGRTGSP